MSRSIQLRSVVAQGWTTMFIIFVANLTIDIVKSMLNNGSSKWAEHIGLNGAQVILAVMFVYAIMPMLIRGLPWRGFRPVVVAITVLMTLFVAAHEVSHLMAQDKPFGFFHVLDITHHVMGVAVIVAAVLWAREKD